MKHNIIWSAVNRLFVVPLRGSGARVAYRREMCMINWDLVFNTQAVIDECSIELYERG